ncbi:MAG: hypothetical protein WB460_15040 [Candidatus Acidiferrales bacterium]
MSRTLRRVVMGHDDYGNSVILSDAPPCIHEAPGARFWEVWSTDRAPAPGGQEVQLKPGDIVVQRGTDHAWQNKSGHLARMAFILLGGEFGEELRAKLPDMKLTP